MERVQQLHAGEGREAVFARLASLRRLIRAALVLDKVGWLVACAIAAAMLAGVIDFGLRLPAWVRMVLLVIALAAVTWYWLKRVRPAANFRPSLEELALRVERGRDAGEGVTGVLASGVGLVGAPGAEVVVDRARSALGRLPLARVVDWRRPAAAALVSILAGAALAAMLAFAPLATLLGARRVLTPWSGVEWPKRTGVRDITGVTVHPLGNALTLRAALVKGDPAALVTVKYRVGNGPVREQALSSQGREVLLPLEAGATEGPLKGALLETLLESGVLAAGTLDRTQESTLEYWFASADDRTDTERVRLVPPPAVVGAQVSVTAPQYAREKDDRVLEAGPGTDQRATVAGVLAGSRVELTLRLNKPVQGLKSGGSAVTPERIAWARAALGEQGAALAAADDTTISSEPTVWRIAWTQRETVRIVPHPLDTNGLEPSQESVYRVEMREDRLPEVVVVQPAQDIEVLVTAKVPVVGEARDDVGIRWAELAYLVAAPKTGSTSDAVEPTLDYTQLLRVEGTDRSATLSGEIDLQGLNVTAGQEVWLTAVAADTYEVDGKFHEPVRSAVRRVKVISPEAMVEQVWNELAGVRRAAVKATEQQDALTERTKKGAEGLARPQSEITDGTSRMSKTATEIAKRVRENGLSDQDLDAILSQARSLAEQAKEASRQAAEAARKADEAKAAGDPAGQRQSQSESAAAQERSARALEQLAETLDRGQDAWSTTRAVQRLIEDQAALRKQTADLGEKTVGKGEEELSAAEKQKIAELSEKQEQLAKRTDDQLKKLQERAQQMKSSDQAGAAAMEVSAKKGQQSGASEQMQQAAQQIKRNQQQGAGQQQQQAQKSLEQVLEQLKQNQKSRDATLKRQMASLIETLNRLITLQELELGRVTAAIAADATAGAFKGLDQPMLKLHNLSLGAVSQAREAGKEGRRAAALINDAASAQQAAIVALRAEPVDGPAAETAERESVARLTEARNEAQKQQDDAAKRDADRQRAELKQRYQAMLTEQAAVRAEGADLMGKELDRRLRSRARGLADREDALADQASALMNETAELKSAELFVFAHDRLDTMARAAAEGLRAESIGESVTARQRGVERVLRQLIDALEESKNEEEKFREAEQGGGGGGGGGGQPPPVLPPAAEVKLLKSMQQEALALTREANDARDRPAATEAANLQRALAERGAKLLKQMQQEGGGQ
ncbi:MAG: hypothetical protein Q8L55_13605 [Phycisphaerales bacterium]|nr:hypothetical protein [Phycisphaerales bacterium]